ncbi:MAG: hypothetical protein LC798_13725 [Chloroflexi bacterium]|nr:hypothetical protein [Chloroflexota bacterium]
MTLLLFLGAFLALSILTRPYIRYSYNGWYAFDKLLNALTFGDPDETISSRIGKAIAGGSPFWRFVGSVTFLERHFLESVDEDKGRHSTPVAAGVVSVVFIIVAAMAAFA